jgi:hypothetical protein
MVNHNATYENYGTFACGLALATQIGGGRKDATHRIQHAKRFVSTSRSLDSERSPLFAASAGGLCFLQQWS